MYQLVRHGVSLRFEDVGKGAPPLVLLHDLASDHTSYTSQIEHFRRNHRVVAVDLRGHGQSDEPEQEYTVAGFADDVAWLCYELGVYRPTIVGHGLGGLVGLDLAARYPDLPGALVALNSPILPPPESHAFRRSFAERLRASTFREALRVLVEGQLLPDTAPCHVDLVLGPASSISQQTVTSAWENALTWNGTAAAAACGVPILFVDGGTDATDLQHLRKLCPQLKVGKTAGTGHYLHLEAPRQVNAMIDGFLDLLTKPSG